jgi:hypothetical protein
MPPLHPDLAPLAGLVGTWSGRGEGHYPTIDSFEYDETITFGHVGKPFLAYGQRTRSLSEPPLPLHAEAGYWRAPSVGRVELILAHPTGITEIEEGTLTESGGLTVIEMSSTSVGLSASAKSVTALTRRFEIAGDTMTYDIEMAAVGEPLTHHLRATLHRSDGA